MRILKQSHRAEKCKRGPFRLVQDPFRCKTPKKNRRGDPLKTLKNFEKVSQTKPKKGRGKSHSAEKLEGGTLLGFALQGRGLWMRSKSNTEYFW